MKRHMSSQGFSIVEAAVVILVVGVVGFGGWFVYQRQNPNPSTQATAEVTSKQQVSQSETELTAPDKISTSDDLSKVSDSLDAVNLDSDATDKELDESLNF